jgi:hypothetical protein
MKIASRFAVSLAFIVALTMQAGLFADDKKAVKVFETDGVLANMDAKDKTEVGGFCKTYKHKLIEGRSYQIDLTSKAFDAFLRLEDAKGKKIAENDDGGKGADARITYKPAKTAEFTIVCTTFAPGDTGKFTLTIHDITDGAVKD